ncbi:MAG TPA: M14 family zinc carboxypeptidase [Vicinamibacterales bacterium]|nr:M14 family zinc carboxypeptidase [Vicinamibacterales bacterium]
MSMRISPGVLRRGLLAAAFAAAAVAPLPARQQSTQPQDAEFARLVREWTTKPEFLSPLVDHLPKVAGVPSPKDVLGYYVGAPKKLTYYADMLKYYRALAAASPRVKVINIGTTDEGRECVIVYVGSDESIRNLDQEQRDLAQLADPRDITDAQAKTIIARAKPIYHLMGGLHSSETGPPEMLMELAYRIAVEDSPVINQIRDNVIVTITPAAEPDGRDRYVDWYNKYLIDRTDERDRMPGPPYWGKYALHDNNRDINYSQVTMRTLLDWYLQWHPPIIHELHESVPFMYTFSGQAPQNPTLDPILYGELPWFSNFEMAQMTKYGMPGVWTHAFVDMWSPGYLGFMASNHNGMMRMYETFGNGGATTMKRTIGGEGGRGNQTSREWYRPLPPYKEVVWSMRNNTNYMETGVLSGLQLTAAFPKAILENFYTKSRHGVDYGKKDGPYGFVIPGGQRDMTRAAFVVNILRTQGIEVGRTNADVKVGGTTYPAGSFVVKAGQPYFRLAKILLEKQDYPDPSLITYDNSAWTMGLMSNVDVKQIDDKTILDVNATPVDKATVTGTTSGTGPVIAVMHNGANSLITFRYRLKDVAMQAAEKAFKAGSVDMPAGSFIIDAGANAARVRSAVEELGLRAVAMAAKPNVPMHDLDLPRLAVYSTWGSTQEVGWVRHAFDQFAVPYDLIYKERVLKGDLARDYDVIIVPSQGRSGKSIVYDLDKVDIPVPYKKDPKYKSLGMYGESDDITGGMGLEGVVEFEKFLNAGGVLMTMGASSFFPPEFGLTRDIDASRAMPPFYAPGPIVDAEIVKPLHPIFYGYDVKEMPKKDASKDDETGEDAEADKPAAMDKAPAGHRVNHVPVRYAGGPLLQVPREDEGTILMRFVGGEQGVLSGLMRNPNTIRNRPAIVDAPAGKGRVILFATNPIYRWQTLGEFGMMFNAILNYDDMKVAEGKQQTTPAARPRSGLKP